MLPPEGALLLSIADRDKAEAIPLVKSFAAAGYQLYATEGTAAMIDALGLPVVMTTKKLDEGHPNVLDVVEQGLVDGRRQHAGGCVCAQRPAAGWLRDPARGRRTPHPVLHVARHRAGRRGLFAARRRGLRREDGRGILVFPAARCA